MRHCGRYLQPSYDLKLSVKRHGDVSVCVALVEAAAFTVTATEHGRVMKKLVLKVRFGSVKLLLAFLCWRARLDFILFFFASCFFFHLVVFLEFGIYLLFFLFSFPFSPPPLGLQVRNSARQYIRVYLSGAAGAAELWSTSVAGKPVKPANDGQVRLIFISCFL